MRSAACGLSSAVVTTAAAYQDESLCCPTSNQPSLNVTAAALLRHEVGTLTAATPTVPAAHDRHAADAVAGAAYDDPVAVGHIDQYVPLLVEEAHDLKCLEQQAAPLVEDTLAILDFPLDLDRTDLTARDAGVAGVFGHAKSALHPSGLGSADVAGDAVNFGVVKTVDDDLVVGAREPKLCADGAGGATLGPADDPHAEQDHGQHRDGSDNNPEPSHDVLAPLLEGWRCPGGDRIRQA